MMSLNSSAKYVSLILVIRFQDGSAEERLGLSVELISPY